MFGWMWGWQAKLAELMHFVQMALLVASAVIAVLYIPLPRLKIVVAGICLIAAAAIGAYDAGYRARGKLTNELQLKAQLEQAKLQAAALEIQVAKAKIRQAIDAERAQDLENRAANMQAVIDDAVEAKNRQVVRDVPKDCPPHRVTDGVARRMQLIDAAHARTRRR
jgi:hypothetical protein